MDSTEELVHRDKIVVGGTWDGVRSETAHKPKLQPDESKLIFKERKIKITWLNPSSGGNRKSQNLSIDSKKARVQLFPAPVMNFAELKPRYDLSNALVGNVTSQGYNVTTEVQLSALPLLMDDSQQLFAENRPINATDKDGNSAIDLLTVAPTGSGKTLAFLIPLIHRLRKRKGTQQARRFTSAIILAPTKELASQIVNEGRRLTLHTGIKVTQVKKGMSIGRVQQPSPPETTIAANEKGVQAQDVVVKADILVSTPGLLNNAIAEFAETDALSKVQDLILDEADVLLDPLFREQTLSIWNGMHSPSLRVSMWSATMGSNIEELARLTIETRRRGLAERLGEDIPEAPLVRLVVGLKDSAVGNVKHELVYAATEQGKLIALRQLLHPRAALSDASSPLRPPFLVFTQTIERAIALHAELLYDIPPAAGGARRIAVLHSGLSDSARALVMTGFRTAEIWVLITTDLLSRGVDFRGVNGVVNYDIPSSSAAYVHRVGRTGRAGRAGGVAVTLYDKDDIPYLKHVATVISAAQKQGGGDPSHVNSWLLNALPKLSKNEKQRLKKRGVEARASTGAKHDAKAARRARISSKAGYVRKEENRRKGAIESSRRKKDDDALLGGDGEGDSEFTGFD